MSDNVDLIEISFLTDGSIISILKRYKSDENVKMTIKIDENIITLTRIET